MTSEFYIRSVAAPGQFSFSLSQEMLPVQLFQLIGGVFVPNRRLMRPRVRPKFQPYLWTRRYMTL